MSAVATNPGASTRAAYESSFREENEPIATINNQVTQEPTKEELRNKSALDLQEANQVDYAQDSIQSGTSDKPIVDTTKDSELDSKDKSGFFVKLPRMIDWVELKSCYAAIIANVLGGFLQLSDLGEGTKKKLSKLVNNITSFSFSPYAISGVKNGIIKKNPFQTFGFLLEAVSVWFGDLKDKFLIRGLATGTDQIWVATDPNLPQIKDGKFETWTEGFTLTAKTAWKLLKEIFTDPLKTLWTFKFNVNKGLSFDVSKGHHALFSSFGDIIATLGYALTGKEKLFGTVRDTASWFFDLSMLFSKHAMQKTAGVFFILESTFDFIARFIDNKFTRLFVNQLSHASGRIALTCYKNSDAVAKQLAI